MVALLCVPRRKVLNCGPVHRNKGAGTAELNGDIGWKRRCEDGAIERHGSDSMTRRQKTINTVDQITFAEENT
jgi:hypothetical protein